MSKRRNVLWRPEYRQANKKSWHPLGLAAYDTRKQAEAAAGWFVLNNTHVKPALVIRILKFIPEAQ